MATISSIYTASPIEISNGGSGLQSFDTYSVVCGGTTSTSPLQFVAFDTSGKVFQSNGSSALPSFETPPSTYGRFQPLASDPSAPSQGQVWFNINDNAYRGYDGSSVVTFTVS